MSAKRRKRHGPGEIVRKLRDADAVLSAGKDQAAVLQGQEVRDANGPSSPQSSPIKPGRAADQPDWTTQCGPRLFWLSK